ncbi:protein kinase domain-containing protein [Undibacterium sp. JH2W]|uniref:protein kinase domain-containing protein n=1 Tax=Undibacterium sp. JH2W TaxID=3413037 RepID=UPI003BF0B55D
MNAAVFALSSARGDFPPIGHYQLRHSLGEGGFGQVFEAWDEKLRRRVAIKRMKHENSLQGGEDLTREARMAASLHHAAFVKIYALEEDQDSQSIVMELVPGKTLRQLLSDNASTHAQGHFFTEAQALVIVRQVAEAMCEAHEANLVHGDLKPSNLMQEPSGTVRILDFGLANKSDPEVTVSMARLNPQGTIAYMAPERLLGAALSPQVDIYALGVILYELASGQRPFANLSGMALAAAQVQSSSDQWVYSASMSPGLVQLIRAMTAREPAQRLKNMQQVLAGLAALLDLPAASTQVTSATSLGAEVAGQPASLTALSNRGPGKAAIDRHRVARMLRHKALVGSVLMLGLLGAGWKFQPYLAEMFAYAAPFSESLEMQKGLAALEQWDRPGSVDEAVMRFTRIAERNPENAAAVAGLSIAYSVRYHSDKQDATWLQQSIASAQQALKLNPHLAVSHIAQGNALREQGKYEAALASYERARQIDPKNVFAWEGQINVLRAMGPSDPGSSERALTLAKTAIQFFPQNRTFADQIGVIYASQGRYKDAEQAFRQSISIQPDAVNGYANLSGVLMFQNRTDEAMHILQQGLQIRPNARLYANLGNAYFVRGDYVEAASAFESAVSPTQGNPGNYENWANLADTLLLLPGRKSEAVKAYDRARQLLRPMLAKTPDDTKLMSRMALYAARGGDKDECMTLLARALHSTSSAPDLHFRAGLAFELVGERKLALDEIAAARRLGYPHNLIDAEPDLVALRRDPKYVYP